MIDEGFAVIFGWDSVNYMPTKLDSDKVNSGSWAVIDRPESIWFWHMTKNVRVDLVFDLPVSISDVMGRAIAKNIHGNRVFIASPEDLEKMKVTAFTARPSRTADKHDLDFLRNLIEQSKNPPEN
ncbi:MAG: hypothetical protein AAB229_09105 [Candidatus Hydrogenedentota bacterium]